MDRNDLMPLPEVAAYLGMRPGAIYSARSRGQFPPAARLGGRLVWRRSDIQHYLEELVAADERDMAEHRWRQMAVKRREQPPASAPTSREGARGASHV
ncbi:helix-turn-helix domain-containing protein [Dermacoccus nishinomiyaensis]|uniref:helix-turn-helix transcriptional regulator n=1 Tax=Dermacoccus TaxID=57495 RepID=UPI000939F77E|nr:MULTISPECIES: helix-turn-helix domain-containing protein [Dermacoccus]TJZ95077.1 helix-turn-helix domain-containing protein [Dermacoccus nishinomiyaensis]